MFYKTLISTIALLLTTLVQAHDYQADELHIDHPWSRQAAPHSKVISAYFQITNEGKKDDVLISASAPLADKTEIHTHYMKEGVMKMEKVEQVNIAAGETLLFKPGSFHLMLFNPSELPKQGSKFPLTLTFKEAGDVKVMIKVEGKAHKHNH